MSNMIFVYCLIAYLIGSIPFGLIFSLLLKKGDLRNSGSGNIGATNAFRTGGKLLGGLTFLMDFLKSSLLLYILNSYEVTTIPLYWVGLFCVIGHIFSIWLIIINWGEKVRKGGKGVATAFGVITMINPYLSVLCFGFWGISLLLSKHVGIASVLSFMAAPVFYYLFFSFNQSLFVFLISLFFIIMFTHKENIKNWII